MIRYCPTICLRRLGKVAAYVNEKVTALGETKDKNIFVDKFFLAVFEANDMNADKYEIWNAIKLWMSFRKFTGQLAFSSLEERKAHLDASAYLRGKLTQYFSMVTLEEFKKVDEKHSHTIIQLVAGCVFERYFGIARGYERIFLR